MFSISMMEMKKKERDTVSGSAKFPVLHHESAKHGPPFHPE